MTDPKPVSLYPTYPGMKDFRFDDYPELKAFLKSGETWWMKHWHWGQEFLLYTGRNKSEHTYTRFRNETERFLLWVFLFSTKPMEQLRKSDILDYADFCWQPPVSWICLANHEKFLAKNGHYFQNPEWSPFKLNVPKHSESSKKPERKKYRPSQQTLAATFTGVIAFFKYLMNEEYLYGNPAQIAKSDCRHFITGFAEEPPKVTNLNDLWEF